VTRAPDSAPPDLHSLSLHDALPISRPERQARAAALGCRAVPPEQMVEVCAAAPVIFNTVPAPVLDRALLERLQPETLIIDIASRSEEHTSELQSRENLVCRLLLEKK